MLMEYFEMSKIVGISVSPIFECLKAYTFAYPDNTLIKFQERILSIMESIFTEVPIYEVYIPLNYNKKIACFIDAVLNDNF